MNLLIIEDEARLARAIQRLLQHEGFQVEVAEDGLAGLELARADRFDVAVVDRMLPGLDGLELVKRLREEGVATPVLRLPALSDPPNQLEGPHAGADDYLGKPSALEELPARIGALARRKDRPL